MEEPKASRDLRDFEAPPVMTGVIKVSLTPLRQLGGHFGWSLCMRMCCRKYVMPLIPMLQMQKFWRKRAVPSVPMAGPPSSTDLWWA